MISGIAADGLPVKVAGDGNVTSFEKYEEEGRGESVFNGEFRCRLAYANACVGLLGLVCTGRESESTKRRERVEEYLFAVSQ